VRLMASGLWSACRASVAGDKAGCASVLLGVARQAGAMASRWSPAYRKVCAYYGASRGDAVAAGSRVVGLVDK